MDFLTYQAEFSEGVEVKLALVAYIDENVYVIYSPALDLYGYGNSEEEARQSFSVTLEEYVRYTHEHQTLANDLKRLGWKIDAKAHKIRTPGWLDLLKANPHFNDVVTNRPFKKFDQTYRLPAFA